MARALTAVTLACAAIADPVGPTFPWGIHLAYGADPTTSMHVSWATRSLVASSVSIVTNNATGQQVRFNGSVVEFTDSGNTQYIHDVNMTSLQPGTTYSYIVGDGASAVSQSFTFTTARSSSQPWTPVIAIYGDMGIDVNAHATLPLLYAEVAAGTIDMVLHVGDMAYDLDSSNGATGDQFMVNIQNISAYVPYHVCPGNHESANDFSNYRGRFAASMPGAQTADSAFHSFNVGLMHIVMVSSEVYFYLSAHGLLLMPEQYAWLEADLASVNRSSTPWIIMMHHRPQYCSENDDNDDCHSLVSLVRDGVLGAYGLEALLYKYGVEVLLAAHEHSYERNYPVYQFAWNSNVTGQAAYVDFDRPIHLLTGAAGCPENQDAWGPSPNPFSAIRVNAYGYGKMHVLNGTHLYWEFVNDAGAQVVDSMFFVKHSHGPYTSGLDSMPREFFDAAREEARAFVAAAPKQQRAHAHNHMEGHVHDPAKYVHELPRAFLRGLAEARKF